MLEVAARDIKQCCLIGAQCLSKWVSESFLGLSVTKRESTRVRVAR